MPEGDTIFRAARTLHRALAGKRVARFETVLAPLARVDDETPLAGRKIESVSAIGKHLIIAFDGGLNLRTHMRMNGSWHIYRSGERWQRPRSDMRIVIDAGDYEAVAFNVPVAEFVRDLGRHDELRKLGPDVLSPDFDAAAALERMRERDGDAIADVLLNQRVMAGIGNIWKSETLFLSRINPFIPVRELTDDDLEHVIVIARKLLTASANAESRASFFVYGRGGQACRRCRSAIQYKKQGDDARGTYWCPKCQASSSSH